MANYHQRYNIEEVFPDLAKMRTGAKDSLLSGNYKMLVTADSSIVIVKSPVDSVGLSNIVWAYDRDDVAIDQ